MAKLTKKQKEAFSKYDPAKQYSLSEAAEMVKKINSANFNASIDIDVRLGVDPRSRPNGKRRCCPSPWNW